jgi:hypothetical protein
MTTCIWYFKGIPASISETYYLWLHRGFKGIFWFWTILTAFPLMVYGCIITPNFPQAFFIFFCCAMLCFVGTASQFKENFVRKVHFTAAGVSAALSLCWCAYTIPSLWYLPLLFAIPCVVAGFIIRGVHTEVVRRTSIVFFLEAVCFISLYIFMLIYSVF